MLGWLIFILRVMSIAYLQLRWWKKPSSFPGWLPGGAILLVTLLFYTPIVFSLLSIRNLIYIERVDLLVLSVVELFGVRTMYSDLFPLVPQAQLNMATFIPFAIAVCLGTTCLFPRYETEMWAELNGALGYLFFVTPMVVVGHALFVYVVQKRSVSIRR